MQQTSASQHFPNIFSKLFSIASPLGGVGRLFVRFLLVLSLASTCTFSHAQTDAYFTYKVYGSQFNFRRGITCSVNSDSVFYNHENICYPANRNFNFGIREWLTQSTLRFPLGGFVNILSLYVHGVFQAATSCLLLLGNSTNVKLGGIGINGATNYFGSGNMYDIRLWNTAKSTDDIAADYFKVLTGSETGLMANYKLTETNGTAAADVNKDKRSSPTYLFKDK